MICLIIQPVRDVFWVVFTQQLDSSDWPQTFRWDWFSQEHLCKIWLQKNKHEERSFILGNNFLKQNFSGKCIASDAQQVSPMHWEQSLVVQFKI